MYPLSFSEFMSVYKGDKYMGLSEYMLYEGIPVVHKIVRDGINAHIILFGAQDDDAILSPMGFYSRKKHP